ncbi:MAG: hypothetical protein PHE29_14970 [Tissierellia bacterium]|nr:hypothetical protein [Tissierellia bacterium]
MEEQKYKKCPFCAEEIRKDAIKCKHSQSNLTGKVKDNGKQIFKVIQKPKEGLFLQTMNFGCLLIFIVIGIIILGMARFYRMATKLSTEKTNTISTEIKTENVVGKYAYNKTNDAYQGKITSLKDCKLKPTTKCYEVNPGSEYSLVEYPIEMVTVKEIEGKLNQ